MAHISRRRLLEVAAAGGAVLTMPRFLSGCGPKEATLTGAAAALPDNPFMAWFGIDKALLDRVMAELTARGADAGELYFQHSRGNYVTLEDGLVSRAYSSIDQGVGLRVVVGDQVGYAYTEDLTVEAMLAAARTASAIAAGTAVGAPPAYMLRPHPEYYSTQVPWSEVGVDDKLPLIQRAESVTRGLESSITKIGVNWGDEEERVLICDLEGRITTDHRPMTRLWVSVTAEKDGVVQSNRANVAARQGFSWYTDERIHDVARQAVDRTMVLFDARRPPAGEMPVILAAGASGILLHEAIGHGMEADFNRKGTSIFSDMLGKKVAEDFITIVDDGTVEHERGALNVDDEGNPTERTVLVRDGILESYLHDAISAKHYGVSPTGNGRRQSFRHVPLPRMRCTYMDDGPHTRDEIIASVEKGIIAETFTNGQVQIGAGDYTFYIKNGWLIEGGKITAPIKDCNIIGNGPESLRRITMAAADSRLDTGGWTCGKDGQGVPVSQGLPTVLVSSMTVGGEDA